MVMRTARQIGVAIGVGLVGVLACVRADQAGLGEPADSTDPRVSVFDARYGAEPSQPGLLALGDRLELDRLVLADGNRLALAEARAIGPLVLLWLGGAEHADLIAWVGELASALPELESRAATLVIVRPLPIARAEAFAAALGLQAVVAADEHGALGRAFGLVEPLPDWAVWVVDRDSRLRYRKLGGRRPELAELLAVVEGRPLRCCIDECALACE